MTRVSLQIEVDASGVAKGAKSLDELAKAGAAAEGSGKKLEQQHERLSTVAKAAAAAFVALGSSMVVRNIIDYADRWSDLNAKLVNATGSQQAADKAMLGISQTARTTYSSLEATANAFLRNSMTLNELGYSMEKQIKLSDALNNSLVISGTKGQQAASVMEAFSKALAFGELRGENFNTVIQSGGRTVQALADGLGVGTLELRKMAEAGQLTSDVVITALISQMEKLRKEAEAMPATVGDGMQLLADATFEYIGRLDQATGASGGLANVLIGLADNFEHVAAATGAVALGMGTKYVAAAGAAVIASRAKMAATIADTVAEVARTSALVTTTGAEAARTAALVAGNSAMFTSTAALGAAQAAQAAHTGAVAANTAASKAQAAAMAASTATVTALKTALLALAGPGAIVAAATAATYLYVNALKAAEKAAADTAVRFDYVRASLNAMTTGELARAIQAEGDHKRALEAKRNELQAILDKQIEGSSGQAHYAEQVRKVTMQVDEAGSNLRLLNVALDQSRDGFRKSGAAANSAEAYVQSLSTGFEELSDTALTSHEYLLLMGGSTDRAGDAAREAAKSTAAFISQMDAAAIAAANSGAAYVAMMEPLDQVTTRTTRLTDEQRNQNLTNQDAQDSIDGIVESWGNQIDVTKEMGLIMGQLRDDMSSAFADMMMNGGNAFDSIAKSFERMIYKMIADFAASKILDMIGTLFNAPSLQTGGASNPGSLLGTIFSGIGGGGTGSTGSGGTGIVGAANSVSGMLGGPSLSTGSVLGGIGAGIAGAGSVFGTTGAVISAAEYGMLTGGATVGAGGTMGAGLAASLKTLGSGAMNLLSAIPGWGWALGGLAVAAKLLDDSGTMSSNGGFLLKDLPSVSEDRKFDVAPFASGFDPVGFNRRGSVEEATRIIDMFRAADGALAAIYEAYGSPLVPAVAQNLVGFDETGRGTGIFFGTASEDGTVNSLPIDQQLAMYIKGMIEATYKTGYFGADTYSKMNLTGSYTDMIASAANTLLGGIDGSHAGGLSYVPFDGYRAQLHRGERVLTAGESRAMGNDWGSMTREMAGLRAMMAETAAATRRTADILLRVTRDGQSLVTVAA
jgi:tape measure domain-containing protein